MLITNFAKSAALLLLFLFSITLFSQDNIELLVKEGSRYHDEGNFMKAIEVYSKALEIDQKSSLVNYEIALSYFSLGDFKESIKYSDVVIKNNDDLLVPAFVIQGSSLDNLGKTKQSIKLFKRAISSNPPNYLLHYNLGLNYLKLKAYEDAETQFKLSIKTNKNHSTSHLALAQIKSFKGEKVPAVLAAHYFLFLEPNTERSIGAYEILKSQFGGNVSHSSEGTNITMTLGGNQEFRSAELMMSLIKATNNSEENVGKSEMELFVQNTKTFFKILGELNDDNKSSVWWDIYIPFFYSLAESTHLKTYCYLISQMTGDDAMNWLVNNKNEIDEFSSWLEKQN